MCRARTDSRTVRAKHAGGVAATRGSRCGQADHRRLSVLYDRADATRGQRDHPRVVVDDEAAGVALAERETAHPRKVLSIVGDGSANYVIQALWTAAQHELPILFVIVRNGAYNILKSFAKQLDTPNVPGLDLPAIDFVSLAKGYGVEGERVSNPALLEQRLKLAMSKDKPYLVEVEIDPEIPSLL
jgi:glyoxylate carboligase